MCVCVCVRERERERERERVCECSLQSPHQCEPSSSDCTTSLCTWVYPVLTMGVCYCAHVCACVCASVLPSPHGSVDLTSSSDYAGRPSYPCVSSAYTRNVSSACVHMDEWVSCVFACAPRCVRMWVYLCIWCGSATPLVATLQLHSLSPTSRRQAPKPFQHQHWPRFSAPPTPGTASSLHIPYTVYRPIYYHTYTQVTVHLRATDDPSCHRSRCSDRYDTTRHDTARYDTIQKLCPTNSFHAPRLNTLSNTHTHTRNCKTQSTAYLPRPQPPPQPLLFSPPLSSSSSPSQLPPPHCFMPSSPACVRPYLLAFGSLSLSHSSFIISRPHVASPRAVLDVCV